MAQATTAANSALTEDTTAPKRRRAAAAKTAEKTVENKTAAKKTTAKKSTQTADNEKSTPAKRAAAKKTADAGADTADTEKKKTARKPAAKKPAAKKTASKKNIEKKGTLVIVESPSKATTIGKFLGKGYSVIASYGHVCDLPKSTLGVDTENQFAPKYIKLKGKGDTIKAIKEKAERSTRVYLATDPDREGEAISWHLANLLNIDNSDDCRIEFNEITKTAIQNAIKNPRKIDENLVDAQQARRILDRLVGYKISPILWSKVRYGLSAGRVQSVATRIIVDREEEIRSFVSEEYWTITAKLKGVRTKDGFEAKLYGKNGKKCARIENKEQADGILNELEGALYTARTMKRGEKTKHPAPPFTTSNLQQEAARKLGFSTKLTMSLAQQLYEGAGTGEGLISYIRTDSVRVSAEALSAVREHINKRYGDAYLPPKANFYKGRKGAQDAHEAIRPTHLDKTPAEMKERLSLNQYKLYKLVYDRFVASQMTSAKYETISADIAAREYDFRATGSRLVFDGFIKVYIEGLDEVQENEPMLPPMEEGDTFPLEQLKPEQHFTQPPPRYNEATLVKALEEKGIGRPSTYAPTISTIIERDYIKREKKVLYPTELGETVTKLMKENFSDIVDVSFTAHMEEELDDIEDGGKTYPQVLDEFYKPFSVVLQKAEESIENMRPAPKETDIECEKCGAKMVIKQGRFGEFLACSNYPQCKFTREINEQAQPETGILCEKCGAMMVVKQGRFGKFYACPNYPDCKTTMPIVQPKKLDILCPKCGGEIVVKRSKRGKEFYGCSKYPKCDFVSWDEPTDKKCPECGEMLFYKRLKRGDELRCNAENCGYKQKVEEKAEK